MYVTNVAQFYSSLDGNVTNTRHEPNSAYINMTFDIEK